MTAQKIAEPNTILRGVVGSVALGLNLEGADDRDELGICIEPPEYVLGLSHFEQWVFRTKPMGVRSEHGDLDLTVYSLRKFCRMAAQGNPSIILVLYLPAYTIVTDAGRELLAKRDMFASCEVGKRFLGYMTSQKMRLIGETGGMGVKRPELIGAHGFDTKYAYHVARLGFQGVEFLETGTLQLPLVGEAKEFCMAIRKGELDITDVLTRCGELERKLKDLIDGESRLPERPDFAAINEYLVASHQSHWGDVLRRSNESSSAVI